ncbi:MAG TPA: hypothetical protein VMO47_01725 [Rhodothermales bacterium]|nr:hypothetical protein [Rhodothermales bacterium]
MFVLERRVGEAFLDFIEFERDVAEGDGERVTVVFLVWWCGVVDALPEFLECCLGEESFPLLAVAEGVPSGEGAQELIADGCRREVVAEDDVVVDLVPVGVGAGELVEAQLDDGEDELDYWEPAGLLGSDDALVPVDEEVVVNA